MNKIKLNILIDVQFYLRYNGRIQTEERVRVVRHRLVHQLEVPKNVKVKTSAKFFNPAYTKVEIQFINIATDIEKLSQYIEQTRKTAFREKATTIFANQLDKLVSNLTAEDTTTLQKSYKTQPFSKITIILKQYRS